MSKTKKQTAIEWLIDKLPHSIETQFKKHIQQAKAMEKEQIIDAHNQSWHDRMNPYKTAEQYYNETYIND